MRDRVPPPRHRALASRQVGQGVGSYAALTVAIAQARVPIPPGRFCKLTSEQISLSLRLVSEGTSVREAAKLLKCHYATLYRALTVSSLTP